jgi:hypothetical protein
MSVVDKNAAIEFFILFLIVLDCVLLQALLTRVYRREIA